MIESQSTAAPSREKALSVTQLRKVYGDTVAVDGVSFNVQPKEIVGLLGPNGAGKTTIINMILGVLEPSAGSVWIEGIDLASHRSQALERTNFAAVYAPLPGNLTVYQNLRVFGLIYGVKNAAQRIARCAEAVRSGDRFETSSVACSLRASKPAQRWPRPC